jgi:Mn2+/Fe2+ NRAMP family transporter
VNPYEVNPYQSGYGGYSPYGAMPQPHPQAVTAMVLGIVGVTVCPFVGYAGLAIGSRVRKAIDAEPQRYTGRGMATAGFVLGIISIITTVLWILFVLIGVTGGYDG